jgi:hypothetical protein
MVPERPGVGNEHTVDCHRLFLSGVDYCQQTDHHHASAGGEITPFSTWSRAGHNVGEDTGDQDDTGNDRRSAAYPKRKPMPPERPEQPQSCSEHRRPGEEP